MSFQVFAADRAAGPRQIRRDRPRERAAVERIEPVAREPAQGPPEAFVHEAVARRGDRATGKELLREPRNAFELRPLVAGVGVLARGDRYAVLGVVDGVGQEPIERVPTAPSPADCEHRLPSRHRARDGVHGQRPPSRDGVEPAGPVPRRGRRRRGPAACIDRDRLRPRRADEPEPVAADGVHVRVGDGDGGGGGDHRLDGVAALAQHRKPGLRGEMVRGDDHALVAVAVLLIAGITGVPPFKKTLCESPSCSPSPTRSPNRPRRSRRSPAIRIAGSWSAPCRGRATHRDRRPCDACARRVPGYPHRFSVCMSRAETGWCACLSR